MDSLIVLIMKPMPHIGPCVLYKHGAIEYNNHDGRSDMHIKWTV